MDVTCIILAAGRSQRFPAPIGKMLYPFVQQPLCTHVIMLAKALFQKVIVVISPALEIWMQDYCKGMEGFSYVVQPQPKGTWDALHSALDRVSSTQCVVLNGDTPLLDPNQIIALTDHSKPLALLTAEHPYPKGYGRIIRDEQGEFSGVIEEKELLNQQKYMLTEVNAGAYFFNVALLKTISVEKSLRCDEFFLTGIWAEHSPYLKETHIVIEPDFRRVQGINTWADYEAAESFYYQLQREALVKQGALLSHCQHILVTNPLRCHPNTKISGPAILQGDIFLEHAAVVHPFCYLQDMSAGHHTTLGPFAKISEKTTVQAYAALGSFVDVKRSVIGENTKSKHFSYLADATIGKSCNIGAFVVTCNYDGRKKHPTNIGNNVFIGSASQLIAPITLADRSYVGAGTTLTTNLAENVLVTRRAPLKTRPNLLQGETNKCVELSQE